MARPATHAAPLSDDRHNMIEKTVANPFHNSASPQLQRPLPCVHAWNVPRVSKSHNEPEPRPDSLSQPSSYQASFSSTASSTLVTPMSSLDMEKAALADEWRRASITRAQDAEKAVVESNKRTSRHLAKPRTSPAASEIIHVVYREEEPRDMDGDEIQEKQALKILLFLAGPCVFLSLLNTIWALISLVLTIFTQPVRICAKRPSFSTQLSGLLGPALNLQLRAIYTPLMPHANEDGSYHAGWLFVVHLLSPFVSFCIMFLSWIVAIYWASSAIVGDPAGMDKRDDGRDTVLGLRKWWESFLLKAVQGDICAAS